MRPRRNRLVLLLSIAATAALVPLATPSPVLAAEACPAGSLTWNGSTGDGRWATAANWTAPDGGHRVPGASDVACIDTAAHGAVSASDINVKAIALVAPPTSAPLTLAGSVTLTLAIAGPGALSFSGNTTFSKGAGVGFVTVEVGRVTVPAGVQVQAAATQWRPPSTGGDLDVAGSLEILDADVRFDDLRVRAGGSLVVRGRQSSPDPDTFELIGRIDIDPGAHVRFEGGVGFVRRSSSLVDQAPQLVDVFVASHDGSYTLTARGRTGLIWVGPMSTLFVRPDGERFDLDLGSGGNEGTLDIEGVPAASVSDLPRGAVTATFSNRGVLRLRGVQVRRPAGSAARATIVNEGVLQTGSYVSVADRVENRGRIEVGAGYAPGGLLTPSFAVDELVNHGTIVATSPSSLVNVDRRLEDRGDIDPWVISLQRTELPAGARSTPRAFAWTSTVATATSGLDTSLVGRLITPTIIDDTYDGPRTLELGVTAGYAPCGGARWRPVSWGQRLVGMRDPVANPTGNDPDSAVPPPVVLTSTGLPAGVSLRLVERWDGYTVVASGAAIGSACSDTAGARLASALFADGLGRPGSAVEQSAAASQAATAAGRSTLARNLLRGNEAVTRYVDGEFRRILGQPAKASAIATWSSRLRSGQLPEVMRADAYGTSEFYRRAGSTTDGWTREFYRVELGRAPTVAQLARVRSQVASGLTRASIVRPLLYGEESDRAVARRAISYWWLRDATVQEQASWAAKLQAGTPELTVLADLAALSPTT